MPWSMASASSWISSPALGARACAPTTLPLCVTIRISPSLPSARARSEWSSVLAVDLDVVGAEALARLRLGQAGVRELGVGERAPRHAVVVLGAAGEEHVAHRAHALVGGGVGEEPAARDVAGGVDPVGRALAATRRPRRPAARPPRRRPRARGRRRSGCARRRRGSPPPRRSPAGVRDLDAASTLPVASTPSRRSTPSARRISTSRSTSAGSSRGRMPVALLQDGHVDAEPRKPCASSMAIGPPPRQTSDRGARSSSQTVSLVR